MFIIFYQFGYSFFMRLSHTEHLEKYDKARNRLTYLLLVEINTWENRPWYPKVIGHPELNVDSKYCNCEKVNI